MYGLNASNFMQTEASICRFLDYTPVDTQFKLLLFWALVKIFHFHGIGSKANGV